MKKRGISILIVLVLVYTNIMLISVCAKETALDRGVSIMCVGESTTYGNGTVSAFRGPLYRLYQQAGIKVNFVGPNTEKNADLPIGSGHAGYGGYYIREIADRIDPWLESYRPQVVFLTIGGNDTSQGKKDKFPEDTRETAPERLKNLVLQIVRQLPETELYVASITPSANSNAQYRKDFNNAIKPLMEELSRTYSNIHFADIGVSLTELSSDLQSDNLHPTEQGYQKMAQEWFDTTQRQISSMPLREAPELRQTTHSGTYMLRMQTEGKKSFNNMSGSNVTIEKNTDYVAKFYVKGDNGTSALVKINTTANNAWKEVVAKTCTSGPDWATYTLQFNSGEYTTAFFAIFDSSTQAGIVYFDDFSLVKADDPDTNLLENKNPGFEFQASNWSSIKGLFSIVRSREVILPPISFERPLGAVSVSKKFTFDELGETGLPNDIECAGFSNNALYSLPYQKTTTFLSTGAKKEIFYTDAQTDTVSIMLHPKDSWQPVRFGLTKGAVNDGIYNDITGFDEMRITFRVLQRTDGTADYTNKKAADYPLAVSLSEIYNSSQTLGSSKEVNVKAGEFEQEQVCVVKRQDFSGNTLDMEGLLKKYKGADGKQHHMQITFKAKGGVCTMIDEMEFIWYEGSGNLEYKALNFSCQGENINSKGLREGTISVSADIYNSKAIAHNNAAFITVLYKKADGRPVDSDIRQFSIEPKTTSENLITAVTIPDGAGASNYEIRVYLWDGLAVPCPVAGVLVFDSGGASGQE